MFEGSQFWDSSFSFGINVSQGAFSASNFWKAGFFEFSCESETLYNSFNSDRNQSSAHQQWEKLNYCLLPFYAARNPKSFYQVLQREKVENRNLFFGYLSIFPSLLALQLQRYDSKNIIPRCQWKKQGDTRFYLIPCDWGQKIFSQDFWRKNMIYHLFRCFEFSANFQYSVLVTSETIETFNWCYQGIQVLHIDFASNWGIFSKSA